MMMPQINLIHLKSCPILDQLKLEEALLRTSKENFCIINESSSQNAIVMGISSPVQDHLNLEKVQQTKTLVIKRFSGGGTVFVDEQTYFVTFIFNKNEIDVSPFPEPILKWSEGFYLDVFSSNFELKENDYVFNNKKFGGNAKFIQKDRWLLHTSFLWDYSKESMNLLKNPSKAPEYRAHRSHEDFLTTLKQYYSSKEEISRLIVENLKKQFTLSELYSTYPHSFLNSPHRKSTQILDLNSYL
jgi:lipoate-protein ligase A